MSIKETIASLITDPSAAHKRLIEYVTGQLSQGRSLDEILEETGGPMTPDEIEETDREMGFIP